MTQPASNLRDLNQFVREHPPRDDGDGAWREREAYELFLHPGVRVRLALDRTTDIGYGLWRCEQLAEQGVCSAEADSRAFAQRLNETLGEHLSLRNLEHIVAVFSGALQEAAARRLNAIARYRDA